VAPVAAGEGYRFRHDPRLMEPSPTYVTEGQMMSYLNGIRAPTLTVTGTTGWPWSAGLMLARLSSVAHMEHHHLVGGHHLHLDDATGPAVADVVGDFLSRHKPHVTAMAERLAAAAAHHKRTAHPTFASVGAAVSPTSNLPVVTAPTQQGERPVLYPGPVAPLSPPPGPAGSTSHRAHSITDAGAVDEAAAAAAASIADVGAGQGSGSGSGSHGAPASTPAQRTHAWSPHHLLVAHTQPATPVALGAARQAAPTPDGVARVHAFAHILHIDQAAPPGRWTTPYRWQFGRAAASSKTADSQAASASTSSPTDLVWVDVGDAASGIATGAVTPQLAAQGVSVSVGAYAPRLWLETMPTLEAFLAAAPAGQSGVSGGKAALEAQGDSY